jgi:hypothetical protein
MIGEKEQWCETLEKTVCTDDEYRYHYGGQCIPRIFARDNSFSGDCLDGSDETVQKKQSYPLFSPHCNNVLLFQCEERTGRYPFSFSCGDSAYLTLIRLPSSSFLCPNKRP